METIYQIKSFRIYTLRLILVERVKNDEMSDVYSMNGLNRYILLSFYARFASNA
jgi:hypothetical protein